MLAIPSRIYDERPKSKFLGADMAFWLTICAHICSALRSSTSFFRFKMDGLAQYTLLRSLELDFAEDGLSTQRSRCLLLFKNMTADLTILAMTSLPRIDVPLLSMLSTRFPSLKTLTLSSTERLDKECCWLCYEESSGCTIHSPIPEVYPSVHALAVSGLLMHHMHRLSDPLLTDCIRRRAQATPET